MSRGCTVGIDEVKQKPAFIEKLVKTADITNEGIVRGFLELVYESAGSAQDNLIHFSNMPKKLIEYGRMYIPAIEKNYKNKKDISVYDVIGELNKTPELYHVLVKKIDQELRILANFKDTSHAKVKRLIKNNVGFLNYYANITGFEKFHSNLIFQTIGHVEFQGDKSHFYKQHGYMNDLENANERITFSNKAYYTATDKVIRKTSQFFADMSNKLVNPDDLNKYVRMYDNSNKDSMRRMRAEISKKVKGDQSAISQVTAITQKYYNELQKMNYGMSPEKASVLMKQHPKNIDGKNGLAFFKDHPELEYQPLYEGARPIPAYLSHIANVGDRMTHQILDGRMHSIRKYAKTNDDVKAVQMVMRSVASNVTDAMKLLHPAEIYLLKKFNSEYGGEGVFNPNTKGYVPSSEDDPVTMLFANKGNSVNAFRKVNLLGNADFKEKDTGTFIDSWTTNAKQFMYLTERLSEFSTKRTEKILLTVRNSKGQTFGDLNRKAYHVIHRDIVNVEKDFIHSYDNKGTKQSDTFIAFKGLVQSMIGVMGTSILATAGVKNGVAGGIGLAATFGSDLVTLSKQYAGDLKDSTYKGDIAREIKRYLAWEAPMATKSDDILVYEGRNLSKKALLPDVLTTITEKLGKVSEFNSNGTIFQLTPFIGGAIKEHLSFDATENYLGVFNNCLLHDFTKTTMEAWMKVNPVESFDTPAKFKEAMTLEIRRVIRDNEDMSVVANKEAIGNFSNYAKPRWSFAILRNADSYPKVLLGAIAATSHMFKQVLALNTELINRNIVTLSGTGSFKRALANFKSPAVKSAGVGGVGLLALALYDVMTYFDDDPDTPTSSFTEGLYPESMTTAMFKRTLRYGAALVGGKLLPEDLNKEALGLLEYVGGVGLSRFIAKANKPDASLGDLFSGFEVKSQAQDLMSTLVAPAAVFQGVFDKKESLRDFKSRLYSAMGANADFPIFGALLSTSNDNMKLMANTATIAKTLVQYNQSDNTYQKARYGENIKNELQKNVIRMFESSIYFTREHYDHLYKHNIRSYNSDWDEWTYDNKRAYRNTYPKKDYSIASSLQYQMSQGRALRKNTLLYALIRKNKVTNQ